jgi:hypothetical protein
MLEKNAKADSLLPALNGDIALAELISSRPNLWVIENLIRDSKIRTKLRINVVYVDGIREEAYCDFSKTTDAQDWELTIGIDFVSASSNTAGTHIRQCFELARDEIGYAVEDSSGKTIVVPPKKVLQDIEKSKIPETISIDLQTKLLKAHKSVELTGECPSDIEAYAILLEVWKQVQSVEMDIPAISDVLQGEALSSCAFSREWNKKYSERATFYCNASDICEYNQSEDGKKLWRWNAYDNRLEYEGKKILFFSYGKKSIHEGGTVLDLRITPLSTRLFLESYLNLKNEPVSLGLIIIGEER